MLFEYVGTLMHMRHKWYLLTLAALLVATALVIALAATKRHTPEQAAFPISAREPSPIAAFFPEAPNSKLGSNGAPPANAASLSAETTTSSRSFAMPAAGMPLKQLVPSLLAEAAAGNERAANRLYKDLMECNAYIIRALTAKSQLAATNKLANVPKGQIESTERLLGNLGDKLAADGPMCSGVDEEYVRQNAFDVLLYAAQSGNDDAATCFVSGNIFPAHRSNNDEYEDLLRTYHANALKFVEASVRHGDWRMANLMMLAYSGYAPNAFLESLVPRNALSAYAWLSLMRKGSTGTDARILDSRLARVLTKNDLSVAQVNRAENWASIMFQNYFIDKPPFTQGDVGTCGAVQ